MPYASLGVVKLTGTVKNGAVEVDLPDGTLVTIEPDPDYRGALRVQLDANGDIIMTPELEAEIAAAEAEGDRGEGISWEDLRAELARKTANRKQS